MHFATTLHQRMGQAVFDGVLSDASAGQIDRSRPLRMILRPISALIIATPHVLGLVGLGLVVWGAPVPWIMIAGALMLGAGIYLRAPRRRNTYPTLRRNEAPALFALLDRISDTLGAARIDGVHIDENVNAYMVQYPTGEALVGLGAPLWESLSHPARIALLGHEVAHLVNGDPARGRLAGAASVTLARWSTLFSPPAVIDHDSNMAIVMDDRDLLGQIIGGLFGGLLRSLHLGFERLLYADSQRAEYLADLKGAQVAGRVAMLELLDSLTLEPLGWERLKTVHVDAGNRARVVGIFAAALRAPDPAKADKLRVECRARKHAVDGTHPPTSFRRDLLHEVAPDQAAIEADTVDWSAIEAELAPWFSRANLSFADAIETQ